MRILYFHKFNLGNGWGGSASMLRALYGEFTKLGHRVDVVSARKPDPYGMTTCGLPFDQALTFGPEKRSGEITIDEVSSSTLENMALAVAKKIELELFQEGLPDLLIANHINLMALACWHLNKKFGIPYRVISYGTDTQLLLRDKRYRDLFGNAAKDAERIFAISGYVAKEVSKTVGGKVEVLGGAVDPNLFFRSQPPVGTVNSLIYFGRLVTEKGIWTLFDAIARQKMATELVLVGEGPLREEIEKFLKRTPLKCKVKFIGYLPQAKLREVLIKSAVVVVPSIWQEPLGLVVLEAFACGLPVIASSVGGIPEMIDNGKNGLLVREGDATSLAETIDRFFEDQTLRKEMQDAVNNTPVPTYHDLALKLTQ